MVDCGWWGTRNHHPLSTTHYPPPTHYPPLTSRHGLTAVTAGAADVLLTHELEESHYLTLVSRSNHQFLGPLLVEYLRIVDRGLIRDRAGIDAPQAFDRAQRLGMHPVLGPVGVVVVVQRP